MSRRGGGSKDTRQLLRKLERQGFRVRMTGGGHYGVSKGDSREIFMPATPSDHRGIKNTLADLKRIGFDKNA